MRGGLPFLSSSFASPPMATIVPIVSKKSASITVNTSRTRATGPMCTKAPTMSNWPSSEKSGSAKTPSKVGGELKPPGLSSPRPPMCMVFSRITASTVEARIEIRMAPRTLRTCSTIASTRPKTNTRIGQVPRLPSERMVPPSPTTKPALVSPMSVMNRPMPTPIAVFSGAGTARKTAVRNPVSTRIRMSTPSITMTPIASAHVTSGIVAIEYATIALMPRPAAIARGKLASIPIRIDITPAISAVAEAIMPRFGASPPPRNSPVLSGDVPMISGFSTMM